MPRTTPSQRLQLLEAVKAREPLKSAANRLNIPISTAYNILQKSEQRGENQQDLPRPGRPRKSSHAADLRLFRRLKRNRFETWSDRTQRSSLSRTTIQRRMKEIALAIDQPKHAQRNVSKEAVNRDNSHKSNISQEPRLLAGATVTPYQKRVFALLCQIPAGRVATYATISDALGSSPRAVGGALKRNPLAPDVPCHRVIQTDGSIGGFMGELHKVPAGQNGATKLALLNSEGVEFDNKGFIVDREQLWNEFEL